MVSEQLARPKRFTLLGVLMTSLAVLTLEIVFTRVFSVLMWYHFAFMVISLALLGSGAAGVWLYLAERRFAPDKTAVRLTLLAALFGVVTVLAFLIYLKIPFRFNTISEQGLNLSSIGWLALIYLTLALPFFMGGGVIALAISRYSRDVGQVYFYDLIGAGLGCLASIAALTMLGAANAVLFVGLLAAVAAVLFALDSRSRRWQATALMLTVVMGGVLASNWSNDWLQVRRSTGYDATDDLLYEKWNALARVTVYEDRWWGKPFGWGLSPLYEGPDPGHLLLLIDGDAGTPIQKWDGTPGMVDFLRQDLTAIAYYVLPEAKTFIIGTGGGRDILTGLLFDAREIVGAELNPSVVEAARDVFGDYAGRVYDYPQVRVAIEDARTYLARTDETFDLIQASLIDTWAASASGAYSLSENGLYTREVFQVYFASLSPRGIVSYSRWYYLAEPTETLRLVALGLAGWAASGVENPRDHLVVIGNLVVDRTPGTGLATMLLKKTPFTPEEVGRLAAVSEALGFTVLYAPGYVAPPNPVQELAQADLVTAVAAYPLNITPPTDDRPFFFNFVRYRDLAEAERFRDIPAFRSSAEGSYALLAVLGIATLSAVLFLLLPLALRGGQKHVGRGAWPYLLYVAGLGMGFMMVMVPSIQRLTVYLGSPTYALAVVLCTILLGSGVGSRTTHAVAVGDVRTRLRKVILALALVIAFHLVALPAVVTWTQPWLFGLRVAVVAALIFPAGFLMGQPFPLGLKWIGAHREPILPWLWAINGATSVIGSALAMVLGVMWGFRAVSLLGLVFYGLALALAALAWEREAQQEPVQPMALAGD